ncbi:hypothetical protein J6590_034900 [Homalodisca vitripennis]|nr:hypothetical protein J6590_034900 [Homalodisca vitripennis]
MCSVYLEVRWDYLSDKNVRGTCANTDDLVLKVHHVTDDSVSIFDSTNTFHKDYGLEHLPRRLVPGTLSKKTGWNTLHKDLGLEVLPKRFVLGTPSKKTCAWNSFQKDLGLKLLPQKQSKPRRPCEITV